MTQMKLIEISSRTYDTSAPEDLTHQLSFRAEAPNPNLGQPVSSQTLYVTAAEAATYTLGQMYDVATTPVTSN